MSKYDPIRNRRLDALTRRVVAASIETHERDSPLGIIRYADDETLTVDYVNRCREISKTWEQDAYCLTGEEADQALTMALLYEEFAKVLTPYAHARGPVCGPWTSRCYG